MTQAIFLVYFPPLQSSSNSLADWLIFSCVENFAHPWGWVLQPNPNGYCAALSVFFYVPKPQASLGLADWLILSCVENIAHPGGGASTQSQWLLRSPLVFFYVPKPQASLGLADWLILSCVENIAHPGGWVLQPNPNGCWAALGSFFLSQSRKQDWDWRIGSFSPASKISPILGGGCFNPIPMAAAQPFGLFLCPKASSKLGIGGLALFLLRRKYRPS